MMARSGKDLQPLVFTAGLVWAQTHWSHFNLNLEILLLFIWLFLMWAWMTCESNILMLLSIYKWHKRSPPISRCDPATIQRESFPPWSTWDEIDYVEEYHILVRTHRLKNNIRAYQEGDCYWSNLSMYCLQTPVLNSVLYAYFDWR